MWKDFSLRVCASVCCVHNIRQASAVQLNTCVRVSELTLVEQSAQINQVVRVEVGGATGLAFDEIAQVARIAPRLLLEVREEYAVAIALAQLPVVRRRNCEAAARDGGLALCRSSSHRLPRRLVCLVHSQDRGHDHGSQQGEHQSRREHRWIKRVRGIELLRKEVRFLDIFKEHTHLEHEAEEQDHNQREVAEQAEPVVAVALEGLGDGGEEGNHE